MGDGKRVLMLCYFFPPLQSSGTARSLGFAKNLVALDWQPTVLTVLKSKDPWAGYYAGEIPQGIPVIRTHEWGLAKIVDGIHWLVSRIARCTGYRLKKNYFRETFCIPDPQIAWFTTWRGIKLARHCDYIYASCSPFSSAISAVFISWVSNKPLTLDFRDIWTLSPYRERIRLNRVIERRLESWALQRCHSLVVNTQGAKKLYLDRYPELSEKIHVIPNGYDVLNKAIKKLSGRFRIVHVGQFSGSRTPARLLEALNNLRNLDIEFIQVGGDFREFSTFNDRVPITVTGNVDKGRALEYMKSASLLYLNQGFKVGVPEYAAIAAKTYEYLTTGIPILADCPEGDNADMIRKYAKTSYVITSQDSIDVKNAVEHAFDRRHTVEFRVNEEFLQKYNRPQLTRDLIRVFKGTRQGYS